MIPLTHFPNTIPKIEFPILIATHCISVIFLFHLQCPRSQKKLKDDVNPQQNAKIIDKVNRTATTQARPLQID